MELALPPAVIIHLHPKGRQDEHYDAMRPEVGPQVPHAYGLCCAKGGDESLYHARKFLWAKTRVVSFGTLECGHRAVRVQSVSAQGIGAAHRPLESGVRQDSRATSRCCSR